MHPVTLVTTMPGSPHWFAVSAIALCGLAACAALWRGADRGTRRQLGRAFLALGVVAVMSLTLAATVGPDDNQQTDRSGTATAHRGDG